MFSQEWITFVVTLSRFLQESQVRKPLLFIHRQFLNLITVKNDFNHKESFDFKSILNYVNCRLENKE